MELAVDITLYVALLIVGILIICMLAYIYHKTSSNNNLTSDIRIIDRNLLVSEIIPDSELIDHNWDYSLDLIATIQFKQTIIGSKIQSVLYTDKYHQKVQTHGMNQEKKHCNIKSNYKYSGLFFSIPLSSRNNSISNLDYSYFTQYVQRIAILLEGDIDESMPNMQETLVKAENLKNISLQCLEYLQFKIILQEPTETQQVIEWFLSQDKFKSLSSNQSAYIDNEYPVYTLEWPQQEKMQVLYFYYIPAAIKKDIDGLNLMFNHIEVFLNSYSGKIFTPDNQNLNPDMYDTLKINILKLYNSMEEYGLEPGGKSVRRLINYT
jgi:hypothetical protein